MQVSHGVSCVGHRLCFWTTHDPIGYACLASIMLVEHRLCL